VTPEDRLAKGLEAAGFDQATIDEVVADVKAAVEAVKEQSGGDVAPPRDAIREAVRSTLEQYGIDPQEIQNGLRAAHGNPNGSSSTFVRPGDPTFHGPSDTNSLSDGSLTQQEILDLLVGIDEEV
jgi:hypothetical protein